MKALLRLNRKFFYTAVIITLTVGANIFYSCQTTKDSLLAEDQEIADESQTENWLAYGRTHNERRFSPLKNINTTTIGNLKVDWFLDLPNDRGLVSTPLVIDGVLYFCGTMNIVRAVDATSGKLMWEYDPEVGKHIANKRKVGWVHNRGISFYKGKIFAATYDGRLIGIDAKTGKELWSATTFESDQPLYITGAPKAFKNKVIIGNGGTENGPSRGYVTAYDADTGKLAWRFYIVPGNPADGFENDAMKMAAETWTGEWWKHGGGGNTWHGFTYDAELDQLYIGTGNGSPWNRKIRSPEGGDNLFLCSVVALDPDDGKYLWHYQTTPGESWDYNSNMDIVLADLNIKGKQTKALLHAPKNGFFYVINRETGKLISADPYVATSWATHIDSVTGRPVEISGARYETAPASITPGPYGAHSWHAMSYNPETGLAYIPTLHTAASYSDEGYDLTTWHSIPFQGGLGVKLGATPQPGEFPSSLTAWDPVKRKVAWAIPQKQFWNAGTLTTAGNLVLQGRADGKLIGYHAATGDSLWSFDVGLGISAPPISYSVNSKQYIALLVGWGGGYAGLASTETGWEYGVHTRRLIALSLEGTADMPKLPPPFFPTPLDEPTFILDNEQANKGAMVFGGKCGNCHGGGAVGGGMAPDLRASKIPIDKMTFTNVVRGSAKVNMGMPSFPDLTDDQVDALMHYIRRQARSSAKTVGNGQ
ncbi:MAG: PQQ-dependent dehydrogenase, methanol/ethanol family [Cyclobacteriaceae bacterium]